MLRLPAPKGTLQTVRPGAPSARPQTPPLSLPLASHRNACRAIASEGPSAGAERREGVRRALRRRLAHRLASTSGDGGCSPGEPPGSGRHEWGNMVRNVERVVKLLRTNPHWEVPWDLSTVVQVLCLWLVGFCLVGATAVPALVGLFRAGPGGPAGWQQAVFTVLVDVIEMAVGLGVLRASISKYRPRARGLFRARLSGQWIWWVMAACAFFPAIQNVANFNKGVVPLKQAGLDWIPLEAMSMSLLELASHGVYIFWTTCMSPVWEEVLFRGFLLPSLTRYLPAFASLLLSSLVFAFLHFSVERMVPLTMLGLLMGYVYLKTDNLAAPVVTHSLWNTYAFASAFLYGA